ncbi:FISUMP domain-containing protein [Fibrobacter sp.]|uniref:FISUMP domain-containing protein n=1 Tax=Fibrobacter sp. TaxID=35828 RepID=UPI0038909D06
MRYKFFQGHHFMHKNLNLLVPVVLALSAGILFTGCSDDEQDFYTLNVDRPNDISEAKFKTLKCNNALEGEFVYVIETEQIFECDNKEWVELFVSSSSEKSSSSSYLDDDEESSSSEDLDIIAPPSSSSYFDIDEESSSSEEEIEESSSSKEVVEESSSSEEDVEESSSSEMPASSATGYNLISPVKPCRNSEIDTCQYGVLEDERDGKTYKTIVIGEQTWMAQNLNYDIEDNRRQSCYGNEPTLCLRFGKLYTWPGAMDYDKNRCQDAAYCSLASTQGICPEGWHIPSIKDWQILWENVGYNSANITIDSLYKYRVINALMTDSSYITWDRSGKGDFFGFSATEHGYKSGGDQGSFWSLYSSPSSYWTSGEESVSKSYVASLYSGSVSFDEYSKTGQFAVRCIKNPEENNDE